MQCSILFLLLAIVLVENQTIDDGIKRIICYYDGKSFQRQGVGKFTLNDLEYGLGFCTHLIYGYAGIEASTNKLISINPALDLDEGYALYRRVTDLKVTYPHLKILLSVGGDKDIIDPGNNKYTNLLESIQGRKDFINSAYLMVKIYDFDGLDLAWQFPKNYPHIGRKTTSSFRERPSFKPTIKTTYTETPETSNTEANIIKPSYFESTSVQPLNSQPEPVEITHITEKSATEVTDGYADFWNGLKNMFPNEKKERAKRAFFDKYWTIVKSYFSDDKANEHKEEFIYLVRELKKAFRADGYLLSLSVLPNVNSSVYYDVSALIPNLDFIILHAYDFMTPERSKNIADYPVPINELDEINFHIFDRSSKITNHHGNQEDNVNFQIKFWLYKKCPPNMVHLGVAAYGRTWKMTMDSGPWGSPPVFATDGAGAAGIQTDIPGMLSWPEICSMLPNSSNMNSIGAEKPLEKVIDPTKRFGTYAFRSADENGNHGIWVGYEDPDTAAIKVAYGSFSNLGGYALVDLSFDDFRGTCTGIKYPILSTLWRLPSF